MGLEIPGHSAALLLFLNEESRRETSRQSRRGSGVSKPSSQPKSDALVQRITIAAAYLNLCTVALSEQTKTPIPKPGIGGTLLQPCDFDVHLVGGLRALAGFDDEALGHGHFIEHAKLSVPESLADVEAVADAWRGAGA